VNSDIAPVQIAKRFADSVGHRLADVPRVPSLSGIFGYGKAQFKWHIEPRHPRRSRIELDAREIVDRIGTLPDEFKYSLESALARGDFQRRTRYQPERAQTGDIGQIEVLKRAVVRDVQEYGVPLSSSSLSFGHISRLDDVR